MSSTQNPKGIDLSHFQTGLQFHEIAAQGISFVYLKATQGTSYVDPTFTDRREAALSIPLRVGSYHFFDPTKSGAEQAAHFLTVHGQYDAKRHLPPAIDLESTPGWDQLSQAQRVTEVSAWLQAVEKALGVRPMIYTSMGWFIGEFEGADFSGHPLWLAHYAAVPGSTGLWKAWTCWQYGERGTVRGAGTNSIDTDCWNGPLAA